VREGLSLPYSNSLKNTVNIDHIDLQFEKFIHMTLSPENAPQTSTPRLECALSKKTIDVARDPIGSYAMFLFLLQWVKDEPIISRQFPHRNPKLSICKFDFATLLIFHN
jgi:hypothetical protein